MSYKGKVRTPKYRRPGVVGAWQSSLEANDHSCHMLYNRYQDFSSWYSWCICVQTFLLLIIYKRFRLSALIIMGWTTAHLTVVYNFFFRCLRTHNYSQFFLTLGYQPMRTSHFNLMNLHRWQIQYVALVWAPETITAQYWTALFNKIPTESFTWEKKRRMCAFMCSINLLQ